MIVAKWLWPSRARRVANAHNQKYHNGIPTAHIRVDSNSHRFSGPPHYEVYCLNCKGEENANTGKE